MTLPFDLLKEKVNSKIKIGWIHTDYNGDRANRESLRSAYNGLDYIAGVSEQCAVSFTEIFPEYKSKVITVGNILSESFIHEQSLSFSVDKEMNNDGSIKLLSIGRFCEAKNFDNVPDICKLIRKSGINAKWYLIGFGSDEELIRKK